MNRRIVLISNTCPFGGEAFLRNELDWIPADCQVTLFPILLKQAGEQPPLPEYVEVSTAGSCPTKRDLLLAWLNSPLALLKYRELGAIWQGKGTLRNLLKALKFAVLSESRARAIRRWLDQNHPGEQFFFYSYWLYECAYAAASLKKRYPHSPFISRCHGFDLYQNRHPGGYLPFRGWLMEEVDGIYPISQDGKAYLSGLYSGKWDKKVEVMRLGTTDHGRNPAPAEQTLTVVSCSNLVEVKRVDRIISALAATGKSIRWIHFGDGALREQLETMAKELPANICWEFRGVVPNAEIMEFYRRTPVDAFLNVSESEGVPVSIMEALSFGIPAVATDVGGTHEILEDGVNGFLLPHEFDNEALLSALDRVRAPSLREQARRIWEERCSAGVNYGHFYSLLNKMEDMTYVNG